MEIDGRGIYKILFQKIRRRTDIKTKNLRVDKRTILEFRTPTYKGGVIAMAVH